MYFNKKINTAEMDSVLMERCQPWIQATNGIMQKAALAEFVDVVLEIIDFDNKNHLHRNEILEQAIATIKFLVNHYGKDRSLEENELTRGYMVQQFQSGLINKLLNTRSEIAPEQEDPKVTELRQKLRAQFKKIVTGYETEESESHQGPEKLQPHIAKEKELEKFESAIQIDCPDVKTSRILSQQLSKKVRRIHNNVYMSRTESGSDSAIHIYIPIHKNNTKTRLNGVKDAIASIENLLGKHSCTKLDTFVDEHHRITARWKMRATESELSE